MEDNRRRIRGVSCPRGHLLRPFATPCSGFACDSCGTRFENMGEELHGCHRRARTVESYSVRGVTDDSCNTDMCSKCFLAAQQTLFEVEPLWPSSGSEEECKTEPHALMAAPAESPRLAGLDAVPEQLMCCIMLFLPLRDILRVSCVSRRLHQCLGDDSSDLSHKPSRSNMRLLWERVRRRLPLYWAERPVHVAVRLENCSSDEGFLKVTVYADFGAAVEHLRQLQQRRMESHKEWVHNIYGDNDNDDGKEEDPQVLLAKRDLLDCWCVHALQRGPVDGPYGPEYAVDVYPSQDNGSEARMRAEHEARREWVERTGPQHEAVVLAQAEWKRYDDRQAAKDEALAQQVRQKRQECPGRLRVYMECKQDNSFTRVSAGLHTCRLHSNGNTYTSVSSRQECIDPLLHVVWHLDTYKEYTNQPQVYFKTLQKNFASLRMATSMPQYMHEVNALGEVYGSPSFGCYMYKKSPDRYAQLAGGDDSDINSTLFWTKVCISSPQKQMTATWALPHPLIPRLC